jgi:DNA-binding NtrC family response regulator
MTFCQFKRFDPNSQNYPDVQVIMHTAHGTPETEKKVRDLGAFDYLEKPVGINELTKIIEKAYRYKQKLGKQ